MRHQKNHPSEDDLTNDDVDMLRQVLLNVSGSYPDSPYVPERSDDYEYEYEP